MDNITIFTKQWEVIEHNINWKKIYKVMKILDWQWGDGIPNILKIKNSAYELCKDAFANKTEVSSGGFTASYSSDEGLFLEFSIDYCKVSDYF